VEGPRAASSTAGPDVGRARLGGLAGALLLLLAAALLHGPRLDAPFGLHEGGGDLYGCFHRVWDDFGFAALRGTPLRPQRFGTLEGASLWLDHPPLLLWVSGALAASEWALRLPSVLSAWLAAVALFLLLRRALGGGPALAAALLLLLVPMVSLFAQMSYEDAALAAGLWLFLAALRAREPGPARGAWTALLAAIAIVGPWIDWAFAFYGLGLLALVGKRSLRRTVANVLLPAGCALLSLGAMQAWRLWAPHAPDVPARSAALSLPDLVEHAVLARPAAGDFAQSVLPLLARGFTLPVLVIGALGLPLLWRRLPRLTAALLVPGLLFPHVFAWHSARHYGFFAYLTPLLAGGAAALLTPRTLPAALRALAGAALVAATAVSAAHWQAVASTSFFRDLGAELDAAAADGHAVLHNFRVVYPWYVHSPRVLLTPVTTTAELQAAQALLPPAEPLRLLWLEWETVRDDGTVRPSEPTDEALAAWLARWPARRLTALEQGFRTDDDRATVRVRQARLVTLGEPEPGR